MKSSLSYIILFFLSCCPNEIWAQNVWVQKDSVGGPGKSACISFANSNLGYIGLGFDAFDLKKSLFAYNPGVDNWDKVESLGNDSISDTHRASAVAFCIGNTAYVGTGQGASGLLKDFWRYDISTNTWSQVANFGGSARSEAIAFALDGKGYVGTGGDSFGLTNDFWQYTPASNTWQIRSPFPGSSRKEAVGFAIGGEGYVGTGDDGSFTLDFYAYAPSTDTWTTIAPFPGSPRLGAVGFGIYPNGFVGTGYDNTLNYTKDFWSYNVLSDTWAQVTDFPGSARSGASAFAVNKIGFVGTGFDGAPKDDFYSYEPILSTLTTVKNGIKVYPNPSSGIIHFDLNPSEFDHRILIFNTVGQEVYNNIYTESVVNLTGLSSGSYYFQIKHKTTILHYGQFKLL